MRQFFELGTMEELSKQDTFVHHLEPRAKLITTICFILSVVSFPKYTIADFSPFFLFPVIMLSLSDIPPLYLLRKIIIMSPFAIMIGIGNPVFDTTPLITFDYFSISGGWISFLSILIRFFLTTSTALILIASTGIYHLVLGLEKLGIPSLFATQILFLYRYLFILCDEGIRILRAVKLRSPESKGISLKIYVYLLSSLLIRTIDRAQRIYVAMQCRGFNGKIHVLHSSRWTKQDFVFTVTWCTYFILFRSISFSYLWSKWIS